MRKMKRQRAKAAMIRAGYHKMNRRRGPRGAGRSAFALNWRHYC